MNFLRDLTVEDMPNKDLKLVAELCGIEVAKILIEKIPGIMINIPKESYKIIKKQYIKKYYNGKNAKSLAIKLGVSESSIYNIIKGS